MLDGRLMTSGWCRSPWQAGSVSIRLAIV